MKRTMCRYCERKPSLCECLSPCYRKARIVNLRERKDLCLIGWDAYSFATAVYTHDLSGRPSEHLVPYKTFSDAFRALEHLNSHAVLTGEVS